LKILVVDDSMLCRKMVIKHLQEVLPQAKFFTAANGKEGYRLFQEKAPDFMIIDLLMPEMTGLELLQQVKQDSAETKVIILSADVQKITQQEAIKLGALKFLTKPFTQSQAEEIAALFSNKGE